MADYFIDGIFDASRKTRWSDDAIKEALQYMITRKSDSFMEIINCPMRCAEMVGLPSLQKSWG